MASEDKASSEREQTDESLRAEREKADHGQGVDPVVVDETADAVIAKARVRADSVLAAARAKSDQHAAGGAPVLPPASLVRERKLEDQLVERERRSADTILREERADNEAHLISEREETDKDLSIERARSDDAIATRDEFLGVVSHDLRNMLGSVIGYAELISREPAGPNVAPYAQRIFRSGGRMSRLIGDLVDVASIHAGKLAVAREPGDPATVATEAAEAFQAQALKAKVHLSTQIASELPKVLFDSARILQVLVNLLSNALKFTPEDGSVTLSLERVADDVRYSVRDTGIGIPEAQQTAIFERYLQIAKVDRRGVGLGLYISKSIIQGHDGKIWVESEMEKGSTFYFSLPITAPGSAA